MAETKMFVGGLSWETTKDSLKEYFSAFGDVTDAVVKTDSNTGKRRGFGFVTFADVSSVANVLTAESHTLDNKTIDPKKATGKTTGQNNFQSNPEHLLKVFVRGVPAEVTEEQIREHFQVYGTVVEVQLPCDRRKKRHPYAFVKFQTEAIVEEVLKTSQQTIGGAQVEVMKARPKNKQNQEQQNGRGPGQGGNQQPQNGRGPCQGGNQQQQNGRGPCQGGNQQQQNGGGAGQGGNMNC